MKEEILKKDVSKNLKELEEQRKKLEIQSLLFKTESRLPKKDETKEFEKIQLRSGKITSIREVKNLIKDLAGEYEPKFHNKIPFFKLMFELNGWKDLNPNNFIKPPICAIWIKQYVYGRFDRELLPTLLKKENPLIAGYIKKYKLFQFLNEEGVLLLEGYIDDVIEIMKISKDWEDFELKYTKLYDLSVQLRLGLKN